jgi:hypothetical protein
MSWHYSQAMVGAFSGESSSVGELSARSNMTSMPGACSARGKTTDVSSPSRFGTMCEPSTVALGLALWMSSLGASRARTLARREEVRESLARGQDYGLKWRASLARWDRATSSWRTPQCSLLEGLDVFSETWPRWGMMRSGECWGRAMPVLRTCGKESGYWPTPVKKDAEINPSIESWRESFLAKAAQGINKQFPLNIAVQVLESPGISAAKLLAQWPTPTVSDGMGGAGRTPKRKGGDNLRTAVRFPTPTVQDSANNGGAAQMERNTKPLKAVVGGSLNPLWVEWLMGWPLGWTDCGASAMDKFRQWCGWHGKL